MKTLSDFKIFRILAILIPRLDTRKAQGTKRGMTIEICKLRVVKKVAMEDMVDGYGSLINKAAFDALGRKDNKGIKYSKP